MPSSTTIRPEQAHDEHVARLHTQLAKAIDVKAAKAATAFRMAGFRSGYIGSTFCYFKDGHRASLNDAEEALRELDQDERDLSAGRTPRQMLHEIAVAESSILSLRHLIAEEEERYTGWSRFFLVTSSPGHIHSSMHCHSCRPTTSYGWLPELSGRTEQEAVEAHGPALCSVCFASAPVDWQGGKITRAQAERKAFS